MTSRPRLAWFLARRYLAARRGGRFLSFITWVALGGIVVGVTALVVVIGVMTGMTNELREKILGSNPHVLVLEAGESLRVHDWRSVVQRAGEVESVVAAAPLALTRVGLVRGDYSEVLDLYGMDMNAEGPPLNAIHDSLRSGAVPLERESGGLVPLAVGSGVAGRMNLAVGDTVLVVALETFDLTPNADFWPRMAQWQVSAVFTTGIYDYDLKNGYAELADVQELLQMDARAASFVGVRSADPWKADETADAVREAVGGFPYVVDPWTRTNRQLFGALKLEKLAMAVVLSLIVLVAAFNIVSTLVMVVVDRTREIGILKAMGLTRRDTLLVFLLQGLWIGAIGTVAGVLLGAGVSWAVERYQLVPIPPDIYLVDRLPVAVSPFDVFWIAGVSMAISFAATIYPARRAASLRPVEAIRHE